MADDDSSELSSLSSLSPPPSDVDSDLESEHEVEEEQQQQPQKRSGILKFFTKVDKKSAAAAAAARAAADSEPEPKETTPPRPKREPSPPHEYVLADNGDIAFIVMFRARFTEALPKSLANFGPQELERDVVETIPGERVEHFLCALLGLLLNRKQDVKRGHYNRALEEAIQSHKGQWPREWEEYNPLANSATFATMTPVQRLTLLRTLVLWTLSSSDAIKAMINKQYKNRHDDDLNIPLSVQPWGSDGDKRRYFLVEGNDDTSFRVYRESNPAGVNRTWWSVAGSIEDLHALCQKLETQDGGPKARALAKRIQNSIPRFEATEEKRRRREYRVMRKEQFKRPESGFSLYEGRTRGKRMKYTYSDDEAEFLTDDSATRRSARNTRNATPAEPVTTASGRQIRAPTRLNVETASTDAGPSAATSVQGDTYVDDVDGTGTQEDDEPVSSRNGRPRRSAAVNHGMNGWAPSAPKKRKSPEYDSEEESDEGSSPDYGDDEDEHVPDDDEEEEDDFEGEAEDEDMDQDLEDGSSGERTRTRKGEPASLVLKFPIRVAFDEENKVRQIEGPPITAERRRRESVMTQHKRPRAAHRNVIMTDDSESGSPDEDEEEPFVPQVPEKEEPAAEVISVAVNTAVVSASAKQTTPPPLVAAEVVTLSDSKRMADDEAVAEKTPLTPASGPTTTALTLRGSPEKLAQQQINASVVE